MQIKKDMEDFLHYLNDLYETHRAFGDKLDGLIPLQEVARTWGKRFNMTHGWRRVMRELTQDGTIKRFIDQFGGRQYICPGWAKPRPQRRLQRYLIHTIDRDAA